jgi:DNA polymerase III subunit epsilon
MNITISFGCYSEKVARTGKGKSLLSLPPSYTVIDIETTGLDP